MKKQLQILCIVIGTISFAQSTDKPRLGIKAGGNLSSITGSDSKSTFGFYAGAFVHVPISAAFSIQPEVMYSQQGAKAKDKSYFGIIAIKDRKQILNYINVPIMVQYSAFPKFYLEAGPEFGFLINAKVKENFMNTSLNIDNKDTLKTFNLGLGIGLGYKFTPNIGVNARYIAGLTEMVKDGAGESSKNMNFQLGVNYYF